MLAKKPASINQLWLIEDDEVLREFMAHSLIKAGYTVEQFDNVDTAHNKLSLMLESNDRSIVPDLIITDNSTPAEMKGAEFAIKHGKHGSGLPIILCSAEEAAIAKARDHTIRTMSKPFQLGAFVNMVHEAANEIVSPKSGRSPG